MAEWKSRVGKLALVLAATLIAGCPPVLAPQLSATPAAVDFGAGQTTRNLSLANTGGGTLTWTAQEVTRADSESPWVAAEIPWLSLSTTEGAIGSDLENVTLTASRDGLDAGLITNTGVQITSNGGTTTVPVSLTVEAALNVSPLQISLSSTDTTGSFTISNSGNVPLSWSTQYLPDPDDVDSAIPFPNSFTVSPGNGTNQALASASVSLTFPAGQTSFGVLVTSTSGRATVRFNVGASLSGLIVNPAILRVSKAEGAAAENGQPTSTLTLENDSTLPISWTISLADRLDRNTPPPLAATPILGTTAVGATSEVSVRITDPAKAVVGEGRYELTVRSGDSFQVVPVVIDVLPVPDIALSFPPDTVNLQPPVVEQTLLDFGKETIQQQFWVVNVGNVNSELFFDIIHDDQDSSSPLIASIAPSRGDTNGADQDFFLLDQQLWADGVPITVTIDRSKLVEDVETRTISVRAFDSNFVNRLATVEVATIDIRVEKQPLTVTGALNRSRPPNIMRYVFSNRNDLGQIVPLQTTEERSRLSYAIFEDEVPLDLNETSQFLTYDYRGNVVLMLDYTSSMYNAGTTGEEPLEKGEAVALMREAAAAFIADLPPNFKLQLMYFSDRSPENRIIQPFTSDKALLKSALERFNLTPAQFGSSDINEALVNAMDSLVAEDPLDTLPLDDADVRAIVYITDGEDNVSGVALSEVESEAEDSHTRLFPVAYSPNGDPVNLADLITVSQSSGGFLYNAGDVRDLRDVLGTGSNMELSPQSSSTGDEARFTIRNLSGQAIFFDVSEDGNSPWLGALSETSGVIEGNASKTIAVELNTGGIAPGTTVRGALNVTAGDGNGTVGVQFTAVSDTTANSISTFVQDEPGTIWEELNNQAVVTYITPKEEAFAYLLSGRHTLPDNRVIEGAFERDGVFLIGDPRVGQVTLKTAGIQEDLTTIDPDERFRADVYVYADYIPRNTTSFSFRFHLEAPGDVPPAAVALLDDIEMSVELADDGILADDGEGTSDWRLITGDGDGRYRAVTDEENYLPVGAFGNLLKITLTNLDEYVAAFGGGARQPALQVAMRMDNQIYVSPQSERQPSGTNYFLFPGGPANAERLLTVELGLTDLAPPAQDVTLLAGLPGFDPELPGAFDTDADSFPDFNDPSPLDDEVPGAFVIPSPFEVDGDVTEFTLTIRNDTLDRFNWTLAPASLPAWLPLEDIRYGAAEGTEPRSTLLPGESETIHFTVDRTGQTPGSTASALVEFSISNSEYAFFVPENVPITLVTNP
ncbi:MAG: hypothetical protein JNK74_24195 [Candidatus Hydrogenedentes bacterium]|nr:hypothetical protein [Candidatus Hydrogenedentota bacterium]